MNNDLISRQTAISLVHKNYDTILDFKSDGRTVADSFEDIINTLPSAQPEITLESAIDYLHSIGWMQEHDKILTESTQPEFKWVPVREELPREYGLYLITTNKGNVYLWTYKPEMEKMWKRVVTAWCYLPGPYEE